MAGFKSGLALGAVITGALALWWGEKLASAPTVFPSKLVVATPNWVSVQGSIVGDERLESERPIHNLAYMTCERARGFCDFITVNEMTPGYLSGVNNDTLAIRKWNEREIVVDSLLDTTTFDACNYYEIRVLLPDKDVTYTRLPNPKADKARCEELFKGSKSLRQWRIDDGKGTSDYVAGAE